MNTNATTVFSASKFPALEVLESYTPINWREDSKIEKTNKYTLNKQEQRHKNGSIIEMDFSVMENEREQEKENKRGLGNLPSNVASVGNLLTFNSHHDPYKNSSISNFDNLREFQKRKPMISKKEEKIFDAPNTLKEGDILPFALKESVKYKPKPPKKVKLELPENLPFKNLATDGFSFQGFYFCFIFLFFSVTQN